MDNQTGILSENTVTGVTESPPLQPNLQTAETHQPEPTPSVWWPIGLAVGAGALRLLSSIPNFTPIGALGLYAGGRLRSWQAFALPLMVLAATDGVRALMNGVPPFGPWTPYNYGSFLLYVVLGRWLCRNNSILSIGAATLLGTAQFFLITNFSASVGDHGYSSSLEGLMLCYGRASAFSQVPCWVTCSSRW